MDDDLPQNLSRPARRALVNAGYPRLERLAEVDGARIAGLHGMGPKGLAILREAMRARGLAFADERPPPGGHTAAGSR